MNKKDYALVIGVARYQDKDRFAPLDGPNVDCAEFIDHLVHDGKMPKANIESVVWAPSVMHAFPTRSDVELALQSLMFSPQGKVPRKGRRLYLFTAGHCEAPGDTDINVLTAESGKIGPVCYPLSKVATAIHYSGLFKEIVLFTDGCRTAGDSCAPPVLDGLPRGSSNEIAKVRRLHAYACSLGLPAFEDEIDGKIRGLFSCALIEGLNGKAKNNDGHINNLSLEEYLRVRVGQLGGSALGQEPEVYCPKPFRLL
jgi:hypothetical protein